MLSITASNKVDISRNMDNLLKSEKKNPGQSLFNDIIDRRPTTSGKGASFSRSKVVKMYQNTLDQRLSQPKRQTEKFKGASSFTRMPTLLENQANLDQKTRKPDVT